MTRVVHYHRPSSTDDALALLSRAGVTTRLLGGGTIVNAGYQNLDASPVEVVDLQALALDGVQVIDAELGVVAIGAMTTLGAMAGSSLVPSILREVAKAELPNTLRNMATVGGTIAHADFESVLLAGLLACHATVTIVNQAVEHTLSLADLLAHQTILKGALITKVEVRTPLRAAWDAVRRTPADVPIVAVVGAFHRSVAGGEATTLLGASGVATTPILHNEANRVAPPGDFRGSSLYRSELISTLTTRVLRTLEA